LLVERAHAAVDDFVGRVSGQCHRHQKLKRGVIDELAARLRITLPEELEDLVG